jgi:hypothetical protein
MIIISGACTIFLMIELNDCCSIIFDDSRVTLQIVASLTDNLRDIIYNHIMHIVQATGKTFFSSSLTMKPNKLERLTLANLVNLV